MAIAVAAGLPGSAPSDRPALVSNPGNATVDVMRLLSQ